MRIDQYSRLLNHRISTSGQTFTIPTSDDHTDETWLLTDLYVGELGINITDDKIYMRTNNGIVQIATGTSSSGSTASVAQPWTFASPNIQISTTYSADAITPRSGYYTDLGTTALRWKDLYLGGSSGGYTTINTNAGVILKESTNFILSSNPTSTNNSPIEILGTSSNNTKDRALHLNSTNARILGTSQRNVTIASNNIQMTNGQNNATIAAGDMSFTSGVTSSVMIGYGYGKTNYNSKTVVAGGTFQVRGVTDPGSLNYLDSDWKTAQARVTTTNATTTNVATISWWDATNGGEIIQVKAYIIGCDATSGGKAFSSEILATFHLDGSATVYTLGDPIYNNVSLSGGMDCQITVDATGVLIKVSGVAATTVNWLCSYSYHRIVNLVP